MPSPLLTDLSPGEIFATAFVFMILVLGTWVGIKLYRWNKRDRENLDKRNKGQS